MITNINSDKPSDILYADIGANLPYISHYSVLKFIILLNPTAFFGSLKQWLKKYDDDVVNLICDRLADNIKSPAKMGIPFNEHVSQSLSMCKFWGTDLFVDDFTIEY